MQVSIVTAKYHNGLLACLRIKGHSGDGKLGNGLEVCIALSTLSQSLVFALVELVHVEFYNYRAISGDFSFECDLSKLNSDKKKDYKLITESYLVNIKKLSKEYQDYIRYTEE